MKEMSQQAAAGRGGGRGDTRKPRYFPRRGGGRRRRSHDEGLRVADHGDIKIYIYEKLFKYLLFSKILFHGQLGRFRHLAAAL